MFIDSLTDIKNISSRADTIIVVAELNDTTNLPIKPYYILQPDEKGSIKIDHVRELISACTVKQQQDVFIVITSAETMTTEAENALLKLLEEPKPGYHFILFTKDISSILPTILSRAEIYFVLQKDPLSAPVSASEKSKELARRLITLDSRNLPDFAEDITKKQKLTRPEVCEMLAAAIEISYKSYFATKNHAYLAHLSKLLVCHSNISKNGHIKLHLIADLL